jgi:hypothetical protein
MRRMAMNKKAFILIVLITIGISGCRLDRSGKLLTPSNPARVYYWYADGMVSSGTSNDPVAYKTYYKYTVDPSKKIIAVGIASNDHVYYWYDDGTTSQGTTKEPLKYNGYYNSGFESNRELIGVAIAGNDRVYYWYSGGNIGRASVGTTTEPTKHKDYYDADILKPDYSRPVGIGIDGFYDTVFYWYADQTVTTGTSNVATKIYLDSNLNKEVVGIAIRNGK